MEKMTLNPNYVNLLIKIFEQFFKTLFHIIPNLLLQEHLQK